MKLLYVVGLGRSGSTILARSLGQHPQVVNVGELKHIWERSYVENQKCGCGRPFHSCEFWREVTDLAFGKDGPDTGHLLALQNSVDRVRFLPRLLAARKTGSSWPELHEYIEVLGRLYRAVRHVSSREYIVDSSKAVSLLFILGFLPSIPVFGLHLVRDSRGVAYSWKKRRARPEITAREVLMPEYTAGQTSRKWWMFNTLAELSRTQGNLAAYRLVRYEDFVTAPVASVRTLQEWIGVDQLDTKYLTDDVLQANVVEHTVSGNPGRFDYGPLPMRLDNAWERGLTFRDRLLVTLYTWPLLWRYRYPVIPDGRQYRASCGVK